MIVSSLRHGSFSDFDLPNCANRTSALATHEDEYGQDYAQIFALCLMLVIEQAQHAETERAAINTARERLTPSEERLSRLLAPSPRRAATRWPFTVLAASLVAGPLAR
jgi:hypothetical protein